MKTDPICEKVKNYYEAQHMAPETVADIKSAISAAGDCNVDERRPKGIRMLLDFFFQPWRYHFVPAVLMILVIVNIAVWYQWHHSTESRLSRHIAREIAMNHFKNLASEFQAASIEALADVMPALDFKPYSPELVKQMGLVLQGARYCSIQGHLALQIKLKNASGQRYTIYQAPCVSPMQKLQRTKVDLDSVQIIMWNENDVFVAMAGPLSAQQI